MINTIEDILEQHHITLGYGCGMFQGRQIRYLEERGLLQVGDDDFDRWANSVELEFEVWQKKGLRQLNKYLASLA